MKPSENIEESIRERRYRATAEAYDKALGSFMQAVDDHEKQKAAAPGPHIWRIIMTSRILKLAAAAAVVIVAVSVVSYFGGSIDGATPLWAIEQTIEALDDTRNCVISGTANGPLRSMPFKCQIESDDCLRYESDDEVYVIKGDLSHLYYPAYGEVVVRSGGDPTWYHKLMEIRLWASGSLLERLRTMADDWQETYADDIQTGRESVFVTCTYLDRSIWFQVDVETKLIVRGKLWRHVGMQGAPAYVAETILYNVEMPDETFDFVATPGVKVVSEEERKARSALFDEAWALDKKKQNGEAIELYQQIYEKYPTWQWAAWSLERIGDLNRLRLGRRDKAVELYEKIIREYPQLSYRLLRTYHSLGRCYMAAGRNDKALEAFETCLELGRQRNEQWFVFDDCKDKIAELKQALDREQ
jgi:tetratricopeptide (TPR) repeat protein